MEENKETNEDKKERSASEDTRKGIQSETISELDRADQIAERQARENDRREKLIEREESLAARKAVGGRSEAGQENNLTKEEEEKANAQKEADEITNAFR